MVQGSQQDSIDSNCQTGKHDLHDSTRSCSISHVILLTKGIMKLLFGIILFLFVVANSFQQYVLVSFFQFWPIHFHIVGHGAHGSPCPARQHGRCRQYTDFWGFWLSGIQSLSAFKACKMPKVAGSVHVLVSGTVWNILDFCIQHGVSSSGKIQIVYRSEFEMSILYACIEWVHLKVH